MTQISMFQAVAAEPPPKGWKPDELRPIPKDVKVVGFDTETTGLRWWDGDRAIGVSAAWREGNRLVEVYYPWGHSGGNLDEARVKEWAAAELFGRQLVGHNIRFDGHMMREWELNTSVWLLADTGHMVALLDEHRAPNAWGLDSIGKDYLGEGKSEDYLNKTQMATYHAHEVTRYARQDAGLVLRLHEHLLPMIEAQGLGQVLELEQNVIHVVMEMEHNGIPIDVEKLERWDKEVEAEIAQLFFELAAEAGFRVEVGSWKSMSKLWDKMGLKPTEWTPTGQPSFSDAVLKPLTTYPVIAKVRRMSQLLSLRSKFLSAYRDAVGSDGIMRFGLHQLRGGAGGTISGRFSSSAPAGRGSGINVQQVMSVENQVKNLGDSHIIRELMLPAKGNRLLGSDADQVEYRLFAHYANSPAILKAYKADPRADFHQTVTDMIAPHAPGTTRKEAKFVNFARLYGAGVSKVADMLNVSEAEARAFLVIYDRAFPEVKRLANQAKGYAESRGWVKTMLGRRSRFPGGDRSYKALNAIIQGTAADLMKLKLVELYEMAHQYGLVLRFTVHDEVVLDIPDEAAGRAVDEQLNKPSLDVRVPLFWSTKTGANWKECK